MQSPKTPPQRSGVDGEPWELPTRKKKADAVEAVEAFEAVETVEAADAQGDTQGWSSWQHEKPWLMELTTRADVKRAEKDLEKKVYARLTGEVKHLEAEEDEQVNPDEWEMKIKEALENADSLKSGDKMVQHIRRVTHAGARGNTWAAKKKFREDWLNQELKNCQAKRTKTQEHTTSSGSKGRYVSFDRLVTAQGGHHNWENIEAAINCAEYAISAGEVKLCKRSKRIVYRDVIVLFDCVPKQIRYPRGGRWDGLGSGGMGGDEERWHAATAPCLYGSCSL